MNMKEKRMMKNKLILFDRNGFDKKVYDEHEQCK